MARIVATICLLAVALAVPVNAAPTNAARSCKVLNYTIARTYQGMGASRIRVTYRIFFASNGAVQMYSLLHSSHNQEVDHTALLQLQKTYGLEMVNAPPLRITNITRKRPISPCRMQRKIRAGAPRTSIDRNSGCTANVVSVTGGHQ